MKQLLRSVVPALAAASIAHAGLLQQWQETVQLNGSNCVVQGRQVRDAGGAERTEYLFADGTRLPAAFEAAHQKRWAGVTAGQDGAPAAGVHRAIPEPVSVRDRVLIPAENVILGDLDLAPILRDDARATADGPRPRRIGVFRELPQPVRIDGASTWFPTADGGQVVTVQFFSPAAEGIRIAIDDARIPDDALFMVYATDRPEQRRGPFTRAEVERAGARFWTESIWNARVTLELALPPGTPAQGVSFTVRRLIHTYAKLASLPRSAAQFCEKDVTCQPAWSNEAAAVAGLGNVGDDGFLFCTGCLLADNDTGDNETYFMTANHCVASPGEANTVEFYWFYQTATCDGVPPDPVTVPRTGGGADYLAGATYSQANDFSFLRLRQPPAPGAYLAAWSAAFPATTNVLTCIHHPNGDFKRISFARLAYDANYDQQYWNVRWFSGVTEPGSSGSPLFDQNRRFIGQLYGGKSYCWRPDGIDIYGRFDKSLPIVRQWLQPSAPLRLLVFPGARDFDGDGKADLNTFQAADARWSLYRSAQGYQTFQYGAYGTIPVIADFDGDGRADPAVYHPPTGMWHWNASSNHAERSTQFGYAQTIPVPGDYDADGRTDVAVFEPPMGLWHVYRSSLGYVQQQLGYAGVVPVPADYDGDGRTDFAVFEPSSGRWYIIRSTAGYTVVQLGYSGATPAPGDYDGDGRADITVFDSPSGTWYSIGTASGYRVRAFGGGGALATPGDYDGDNKDDFATYKLSSGLWRMLRSSDGSTNSQTFGWSGAPPVGVAP